MFKSINENNTIFETLKKADKDHIALKFKDRTAINTSLFDIKTSYHRFNEEYQKGWETCVDSISDILNVAFIKGGDIPVRTLYSMLLLIRVHTAFIDNKYHDKVELAKGYNDAYNRICGTLDRDFVSPTLLQ